MSTGFGWEIGSYGGVGFCTFTFFDCAPVPASTAQLPASGADSAPLVAAGVIAALAIALGAFGFRRGVRR